MLDALAVELIVKQHEPLGETLVVPLKSAVLTKLPCSRWQNKAGNVPFVEPVNDFQIASQC
jgi:hypothetical protein